MQLMRNVICALVIGALLLACSQTEDPDNLTVLNGLKIYEVDAKEIKGLCGAGQACYIRTLNKIVILEIQGEHDRERQCDLGHEVWHAMDPSHTH